MEKLLEDRKKIHFDEDFLVKINQIIIKYIIVIWYNFKIIIHFFIKLTYVSLLSKYAPEKVIKEIEEYPDNYNLK